jgi:hypothetical protein
MFIPFSFETIAILQAGGQEYNISRKQVSKYCLSVMEERAELANRVRRTL